MQKLESLIKNLEDTDTISIKVSHAKNIIADFKSVIETSEINRLKKLEADSRLITLKEKLGIESNNAFL